MTKAKRRLFVCFKYPDGSAGDVPLRDDQRTPCDNVSELANVIRELREVRASVRAKHADGALRTAAKRSQGLTPQQRDVLGAERALGRPLDERGLSAEIARHLATSQPHKYSGLSGNAVAKARVALRKKGY